jgi:copper chaperone CopZ
VLQAGLVAAVEGVGFEARVKAQRAASSVLLRVGGMSCTACAAGVEAALAAQPGVLDSTVDFLSGRAEVRSGGEGRPSHLVCGAGWHGLAAQRMLPAALGLPVALGLPAMLVWRAGQGAVEGGLVPQASCSSLAAARGSIDGYCPLQVRVAHGQLPPAAAARQAVATHRSCLAGLWNEPRAAAPCALPRAPRVLNPCSLSQVWFDPGETGPRSLIASLNAASYPAEPLVEGRDDGSAMRQREIQ